VTVEEYLTATISASAIRTNLGLLKKQTGPNVKFCPVVKADCYGHGVELLLDVISEFSDWLGVACPSEALNLRQLGYKGPILVFFSACAYQTDRRQEAIEELVVAEITQTVVDECEISMIDEAAQRLGKKAQVHLKVDTGMGRSGILAKHTAGLVEKIHKASGISLTGIYTHFATADSDNKEFARQQFGVFEKTIAQCSQNKGLIRHAANSAAIIDMPETHLDMVRPGIALYGYQPSDEIQTRLPLCPALRLAGPLLQIKDVPAGSSSGYGLTFTFDRPSRIGRVPVGYGDGYFRCLSNKSTVRIGRRDVPVRGRVSMDQIVVDLTDLPQVHVGDEVEIISADPTAPHSVENLAQLAGTIPYEITCHLGGPRIRRALVK